MNDFSQTPITELAAIVAEHLQQQGIQVVLVGCLLTQPPLFLLNSRQPRCQWAIR